MSHPEQSEGSFGFIADRSEEEFRGNRNQKSCAAMKVLAQLFDPPAVRCEGQQCHCDRKKNHRTQRK